MKVSMLPTLESFAATESGIKRVIEAYHRYLPDFGVELVGPGDRPDVRVVHAGASTDPCDIAMLHGMYWTSDYEATDAEYRTNARIVASLRTAREITVPSEWVAETFRRDLRVNPWVIPHGIEWQEWQHKEPNQGYVLWNKNRAHVDVCNPEPVGVLARAFPEQRFLTTFAPDEPTPNVRATGLVPFDEMRLMVQRAGVYLSVAKETFGIGTLEAMASGVPILGWAYGGNLDLVEHGISGYLARPDDYEDLAQGLCYCLQHRRSLGANGRELARAWTWQAACKKLARVFEAAMVEEPPTVGVVIPVYNKSEQELRRAVESVINQTYKAMAIIVVDDGSTDETGIRECIDRYRERGNIELIRQTNQGVAIARNTGISRLNTKYICPLDSDDWLEPDFLRICVSALEGDPSLGIAYTGMRTHRPDGSQGVGRWPGQADADRQVEGYNQVPTCCVFRRKVWERTGGYRQRYAPRGAGSEDAEFWLRQMAYGWRAEEVTPDPLFNYSWLSGSVSGDPNYREVNWLSWHPWTSDRDYPLAAVMRPKHISHAVRQYDRPLVSVVIPVGPGHEKLVVDALDSLEAQTFRNWEVIVIDDTGFGPETLATDSIWWQLKKAYPYLKRIGTGDESQGAGYARNRGAEIAHAPFLLFLDADDWLAPQAMEKMLKTWAETESVVYSDYVRILQSVSQEKALEAKRDGRLVQYDPAKKTALVKFRAYDFDCERAIKQPEEPVPYYWCLATCMVPRAWHEEIGGFDETMESWEDADYAFRMVRGGHCYARVSDNLVVVRTHTGSRLNRGLQIHENLVKYMRQKYDATGDDPMCGSCPGSSRVTTSRSAVKSKAVNPQLVTAFDDGDMVLIRYMSRNRGRHLVYGRAINPMTGKRFFYGRRSGGDEFLVHKDDVYGKDRHGRTVLAAPDKFMPIENKLEEVKAPEPKRQAPPPPPIPDPEQETATVVEIRTDDGVSREERTAALDVLEQYQEENPRINFQTLPGINADIAAQLEALGLETRADVLELGADGLQAVKGVGEVKAGRIIKAIEGMRQ